MIRFVDLTPYYWFDESGPENTPMCAFMDTITNRFVLTRLGDHTFESMEDVDSLEPKEFAERCRRLVPQGFFGAKPNHD